MLSRGCANRLAIRCSFASPGACSRRPGRLRSRPAYAKACRSEEHTSELQSLMRISYDVFCLKKNNTITTNTLSQDTITTDICDRTATVQTYEPRTHSKEP